MDEQIKTLKSKVWKAIGKKQTEINCWMKVKQIFNVDYSNLKTLMKALLEI